MSAPTLGSDVWTVDIHIRRAEERYNRYHDDESSCDSRVEHVGVFNTHRAAVIAGVSAAYTLNQDLACDNHKVQARYRKVVLSVLDVDFSNEKAVRAFENAHDSALEARLEEASSNWSGESPGSRPAWVHGTLLGFDDALAQFDEDVGRADESDDEPSAKKGKF